jgi:hypothetical protein
MTLSELLLLNPRAVADKVVGVKGTKEVEKTASAEASDGGGDRKDTSLGADIELPDGPDPDELEKIASAVERVLGALQYVRPDLDVEDILSLEGRRILGTATIKNLDDSPFEKVASHEGVLSPKVRERLRSLRTSGRRRS